MIIALAPCGCRPSARVGALKNIQPSLMLFARLFVSLRCGKMEKLSDGKLFRDISQGAFCCNGH